MNLTPYPVFYTPPGQPRPACCPHDGGLQLIAPGPDGLLGMLWGGAELPAAADWRQTHAGWWVRADGHLPQHLTRLDGHPRIPRWCVVEGALEDHWWRVPILIDKQDETWGSALDRLWTGGEFGPPADLEPLQRQVLAIVAGVPLADTAEARDVACAKLAVELLALGQWVDSDLLAALGWLSEDMMERVILAACGVRQDALPCSP
jgi:hypothetical protein